nr:MFS transporter [Actinomycetota bacterium]
QLRWRPARPLRAAFVVWAATTFPPLTLVEPFPAVVVGVASGLSFAGITLGNAIWEATLQERIPGDVLSRVSSYDWLVSLVFMPLGFALAGPAADAIGLDATLLAAATISLTVHLAVLALPSARNLRRDEGAATPAPQPAA